MDIVWRRVWFVCVRAIIIITIIISLLLLSVKSKYYEHIVREHWLSNAVYMRRR